jgi:hypothetical protein
MHVADIHTTTQSGTPTDTFQAGDTIYWRVQIVDQNGVPVSGAAVTSTLTRPGGATWTTTNNTDAGGWAYFSQKTTNSWPTGSASVKVDTVTKSGATYNPAANVQTQHNFTIN